MDGIDDAPVGELFSTGGQVDVMTMALVDAAFDKDELVRKTICNALVDLGKKQSELVLSSCQEYLRRHPKLAHGHRIVLLESMEKICKEKQEELSPEMGMALVRLGISEMTLSKEIIPDWQEKASALLVSLGRSFCQEIMDKLLGFFQPGQIPHFFIVHTMALLAQVNPNHMVPYLSNALATMLPMMGIAKGENQRWVFAATLAKFSEAILDYVANAATEEENLVSIETYSQEIFSAYEILFNVWLKASEGKLRLAIIESIGYMSKIMAKEKLEEQLPKLLPTVVTLLKRHSDNPAPITQGLCMVLESATADQNLMLEPMVDLLLNSLYPLVCQSIDYNNINQMKSHNEVLRCLAVLASSFMDKVVAFLMIKLQNNNEKIRIGTLTIFRHLINFFGADQISVEKKSVIISALKVILLETSNKVKKIFSQVIIAMANHNYLHLEGGKGMIEFLVKQCSLDPNASQNSKISDPDFISNAALKTMCENILQLMTTTITSMEDVLWPRLLEFIVPDTYSRAITSVAKSIAHLGKLKRGESGNASDNYFLNYNQELDLPKPHAIFSRCLVLLGNPFKNSMRGIQLLHLLEAMSPNIHSNVVEMWDTVLIKLRDYLEENDPENGNFEQKTWEDLVLKFLSKTLDLIEDQEWIAELCYTLSSHCSMYSKFPRDKNFLFKCTGISLRKSLNTQIVKQNLDAVVNCIDHSNHDEREGAAVALGFCGTSHLDVVLTKLEATLKADSSRRTSGIFSFGRDKTETLSAKAKSTFILAYGYVALYSDPQLILSRIETDILRVINLNLETQDKKTEKDVSFKLNVVKTVELIGKTLHPSHLKSVYHLADRSQLLSQMLHWLKAESELKVPSYEVFVAIFKTCITLVQINPSLTDADICELAQVSTSSVYSLPTVTPKEKSEQDVLEGKIITTDDVLRLVDDLLMEILKQNTNAATIEKIYEYLEKWISYPEGSQRFRALKTISNLFSCYTEAVFIQSEGNDRIIHPASFDLALYGTALAHFVPRFCDSEVTVRRVSLDCICKLLTIQVKCAGGDPDSDSILSALTSFQGRLDKSDPNSLFSLVNDLSKVIVRRTPTKQLWLLLEGLMGGLLDDQPHSSSAACVVLNALLRNRGLELASRVDSLLKLLHVHLARVTHPQTRTGTLRALRTLAGHCLEPVLNQLLTTFPIPYDDTIIACWQVLVSDPQLAPSILDNLLSILSKSLPYEEKIDSSLKKEQPLKMSTELPLHVTSALICIFQVPEMGPTLQGQFSRILGSLLLRVGVSHKVLLGFKEKDNVITEQQKQEIKVIHKMASNLKVTAKDYATIKISIDCLKSFLMHDLVDCKEVVRCLEESAVFSDLVIPNKLEDSLTKLSSTLAHFKASCISDLTSQLSQGLYGPYDNQRIAVASMFAEFINQNACGDEKDLAFLVSTLLGRMVDNDRSVRRLVTTGLGNMANCRKDLVEHHLTTILSALISAMDDKDDPDDQIALAAMKGLSQVLCQVEEGHVRGILINISLRIRPCLANENGKVRAAAFDLFGTLSRFANGPSSSTFLEQIHANLMTLLLHLNDADLDVVKATKGALKQIGPLMGSPNVNKMFQTLLIEDRPLHYGEFINDLSKSIVDDFPDKINFYVMNTVGFFKSEWVSIRCNAAICVGFLMGNLQNSSESDSRRGLISKEHVCSALIILLKDSDAGVRSSAAEAISLLHSY